MQRCLPHVATPDYTPSPARNAAPAGLGREMMLIAFQRLDGQSYLISTSRRPKFLVDHLRLVSELAAAHRHEQWISRLFARSVVGTALVRHILPPTPHASCSCRRAHLSDFESHWLLTEAFHKPTVFPCHLAWSHRHPDTTLDLRVLMIRRELDRTKIARLLMVLLMVSPGLGVLVGHFSDSADAGIAAGAGIFALASFIQGLTAWVMG